MANQITTVYGLPGVGKSTYCKTLAYKGVGNGLGTWRPEPTTDILKLYENYTDAQVQEIIQRRFLLADLYKQPRLKIKLQESKLELQKRVPTGEIPALNLLYTAQKKPKSELVKS